MPKWKWEGLDSNGKKAQGQIDAQSKAEARKLLRGRGIRPKKIIPPSILEFDLGEWMVDKGIASSFTAKELMTFTKQLSIMINAGVPIIQSLEILYKSQKNPVLKKTIQDVARDVSEGQTIAEALQKRRGFDNLYCNLVKAGEAGGILDKILEKLAVTLEKQEQTKKQIKSAMTYPGIVMAVGVGVVWGLMTFVVPQFVGMFEGMGQKLPAITQFVVDTSAFLGKHSLVGVPVIFTIVAILNSLRKTPRGKRVFDTMMMKLPIIGTVIIKGNLSSFSRTLATMLGSGVALTDSLDICADTIDNVIISEDIRKIRKAVTEGKTLTEPLAQITYFPEMVGQMIKVGEQTGNIDQMLEKVSDVFEEEVGDAVSAMTAMIEPIILVGLGGIVAVILIALYLPMFTMGQGVG